MASESRYILGPDRKGVVWDLLMYVPTVAGLGIAASIFWYQNNTNLAYLLLFLASFFFFQAANRIAGRLLILGSAPVALEVTKQRVSLDLRGGNRIDLVKNVRYFSDYAGKSFGLTGIDLAGAKRQYVLHAGQFASDADYKAAGAALKVYS